MARFNIPWKCLDFDSTTPKPAFNQNKPHKTFAQALSNICDIPDSQLPQAVLKGDELAIPIPEFEYEAGIAACKHNLHGRVIWPKGSTPLTAVALKAKLSLIWKGFSLWGITSIGKGFFEFSFSSVEDMRRVRSIASWNLNPGLLKLFAWSKDFNPRNQQNSSAQVWVRIYGLAQEYWRKNILFSIVSGIGSPICTDSVTAKPMYERTFGVYARVLVEIDLTQALRYRILVERKGFAFYVDLDYENVPDYCTHCRVVGHHVEFCKRRYPENEVRVEKEHKKKFQEPRMIFVQKKDGRVEQGTSKEAENVENEIINVDGDNEEVNMNDDITDSALIRKKGKAPVVDDSPASILKEQDNVLEHELNIELQRENGQELDKDSISSEGTFVEATQQLSAQEHSGAEEDNIPTLERVQKDIAFLNRSWANMIENEETVDNLYETLDKEPLVAVPQQTDNEGFQVQLSKHKKKALRKENQQSKSSISTRSKVVHKPFK